MSLRDGTKERVGSGEVKTLAVTSQKREFPRQSQAHGYAKGFKEAGIDVEDPKELDFASDRPKLMPYPSAKGLTFDTVGPVAAIPAVVELNIGHFLIGEAIFSGLDSAIKRMRALMDKARAEAGGARSA